MVFGVGDPRVRPAMHLTLTPLTLSEPSPATHPPEPDVRAGHATRLTPSDPRPPRADARGIAGPTGSRRVRSDDDIEPVLNERRDRLITGVVTGLPILSLFLVAWQLWDSLLGWNDIFDFLVLYALTGFGVTVGFHRLFTHRAFKTGRVTRAVLAVLGSAAIEGPVISWVADHRKHHRYSDRAGDPHSPTSITAMVGVGRRAASSTPTSGGCSSTTTGRSAPATRRT